MKNPHSKTRGFTLVEICFTIVILASIIVIAIPAVNSALRDARAQQADANTQTLNQAAHRARLAGKVGPGTYGSDKTAAVNWYKSEKLTQDKTYKTDHNSYVNGLWFSNYLGDPNQYAEAAANGTLSDAQIAEILRRYQELNPDTIQALVDGGYLTLSPQALAQALTDGSAENLQLYGNTLITPGEMTEVLDQLDAIVTSSSRQGIYSWDDISSEWGQDYIKDIWTDPSREEERQWQTWKWDESLQAFIPNFENSHWNDPTWDDLKATLDSLPENSSLRADLLATFTIPEGWNINQEVFDAVKDTPQMATVNQQIERAKALDQAYSPSLPSTLDTINQQWPTIPYSIKDSIPITYSSGTYQMRNGTYVDGNGTTWSISAHTYNAGTANEYTSFNISQGNNIPDTSISTYSGVSATLNPNGTLRYGNIGRYAGWESWEDTYYNSSVSSSTNAQGQTTNYTTQGANVDISLWQNQVGSIYGSYNTNNSILSDPNTWAWDVYSQNRMQTLQQKQTLANAMLQYTDPASYVSNLTP